jgi:hypothetical protein
MSRPSAAGIGTTSGLKPTSTGCAARLLESPRVRRADRIGARNGIQRAASESRGRADRLQVRLDDRHAELLGDRASDDHSAHVADEGIDAFARCERLAHPCGDAPG